LRINCSATTEDEFLKAVGMVESRIRFLIKSLDMTPGVSFAHPHIDSIEFKSPDPTMTKSCAFFVGLSYVEGVKSINITGAVISFQKKIFEQKSQMTQVDVETLTRKQLPEWVYENGIRPKPKVTKKKRISSEAKQAATETLGTTTKEIATGQKTARPLTSSGGGQPLNASGGQHLSATGGQPANGTVAQPANGGMDYLNASGQPLNASGGQPADGEPPKKNNEKVQEEPQIFWSCQLYCEFLDRKISPKSFLKEVVQSLFEQCMNHFCRNEFQ